MPLVYPLCIANFLFLSVPAAVCTGGPKAESSGDGDLAPGFSWIQEEYSTSKVPWKSPPVHQTPVHPNTPNFSSASTRNALKSVRRFESFLRSEGYGESRKIHEIPSFDLDPILCGLFKNIRRQDGTQYSLSSLIALRTGLEYHLKKCQYPLSITTSIQFYRSQQSFKARKAELKLVESRNKTDK